MTTRTRRVHRRRVHLRRRDADRVPRRFGAGRRRDERDAGHHAQRRRLRAAGRRRGLHRRDADARSATPGRELVGRLRPEVDDAGAACRRSSRPGRSTARRPIIDWLRALARDLHEQCGGPGVGAIGMCFTGGFALAMAVDDTMLAPVLSQPSLPFGIGKARKRALGLSDADLAQGRRPRRPVRARDALHRRPRRSRRSASSTCARCSATASSRSRSTAARATRTASRSCRALGRDRASRRRPRVTPPRTRSTRCWSSSKTASPAESTSAADEAADVGADAEARRRLRSRRGRGARPRARIALAVSDAGPATAPMLATYATIGSTSVTTSSLRTSWRSTDAKCRRSSGAPDSDEKRRYAAQ